MKKTITAASLILITFISSSAFVLKYSSGIAGYTGSPGEQTCANQGCHSGGAVAAAGITITATPSFTNDEYVPGTTYTIDVTVSAAGYSHYGFDCEVLNDANANIGGMQLNGAGTGVQFLNFAGKRNAVHNTPKTGTLVTFTFKWVAPASGAGNATFYASANAVNGNGNSNGDFPITPVSMPLAEAVPAVTTGIAQHSKTISQVSVYPNPASGLSNMSYNLNTTQLIRVELADITGKPVKQLLNEQEAPGEHSHILNLHNVAAGVYFIKTSANGQQVSQKLITVQ